MNHRIFLFIIQTIFTAAFITNQQIQEKSFDTSKPINLCKGRLNANNGINKLEYNVLSFGRKDQNNLVLETDLFSTLDKKPTLESLSPQCISAEIEKLKIFFEQDPSLFKYENRGEFWSYYNKVASYKTNKKKETEMPVQLSSDEICECLSNFSLVVDYLLQTINSDSKLNSDILNENSDTIQVNNNKHINMACSVLKKGYSCQVKNLYQLTKESTDNEIQHETSLFDKLISRFYNAKSRVFRKLRFIYRRAKISIPISSSKGGPSFSKPTTSSKNPSTPPPPYSPTDPNQGGLPPPYSPTDPNRSGGSSSNQNQGINRSPIFIGGANHHPNQASNTPLSRSLLAFSLGLLIFYN